MDIVRKVFLSFVLLQLFQSISSFIPPVIPFSSQSLSIRREHVDRRSIRFGYREFPKLLRLSSSSSSRNSEVSLPDKRNLVQHMMKQSKHELFSLLTANSRRPTNILEERLANLLRSTKNVSNRIDSSILDGRWERIWFTENVGNVLKTKRSEPAEKNSCRNTSRQKPRILEYNVGEKDEPYVKTSRNFLGGLFSVVRRRVLESSSSNSLNFLQPTKKISILWGLVAFPILTRNKSGRLVSVLYLDSDLFIEESTDDNGNNSMISVFSKNPLWTSPSAKRKRRLARLWNWLSSGGEEKQVKVESEDDIRARQRRALGINVDISSADRHN